MSCRSPRVSVVPSEVFAHTVVEDPPPWEHCVTAVGARKTIRSSTLTAARICRL
jgi:hypothetical protein